MTTEESADQRETAKSTEELASQIARWASEIHTVELKSRITAHSFAARDSGSKSIIKFPSLRSSVADAATTTADVATAAADVTTAAAGANSIESQ